MKPSDHSNANSHLNHPLAEPDCFKSGLSPVSSGGQLTDTGALKAAQAFSFRVPPVFASLIDWQNADDPLLLQVIPSAKELIIPEGYTQNPLDEHHYLRVPGLVAKYPGRVLLRLTGACPIHCRYCFRRHDSFGDIPKEMGEWQPALEWIARDTAIREVIFSGGDPLMLANGQLAELSARIAAIGHVRRLRIHTRMPVCSPGRVNDSLLEWLTSTNMLTFIVIHVNHPAELGREGCAALGRLADAGITLLNQSVLLKGVNDSVDVLEALSEKLLQNRVLPYYLHLLDPVAGAAHFYVDESHARQLVQGLRDRLGGYAVPRLAREIPGRLSKKVLEGIHNTG
ncbi:MAG: KamA family radical SAM protein [Magnetococcales bacterium]|nr:KamA family radical SAM protein [Magnetococcales bacterium]